jgi:hypothetical protein
MLEFLKKIFNLANYRHVSATEIGPDPETKEKTSNSRNFNKGQIVKYKGEYFIFKEKKDKGCDLWLLKDRTEYYAIDTFELADEEEIKEISSEEFVDFETKFLNGINDSEFGSYTVEYIRDEFSFKAESDNKELLEAIENGVHKGIERFNKIMRRKTKKNVRKPFYNQDNNNQDKNV